MKTLIAILLSLIVWHQANAQLSITDDAFVLEDNQRTVKQSFELLDRLAKGTCKNRKVIHEGKIYYQYAINLHKKKRTYLIEGYKVRIVEI